VNFSFCTNILINIVIYFFSFLSFSIVDNKKELDVAAHTHTHTLTNIYARTHTVRMIPAIVSLFDWLFFLSPPRSSSTKGFFSTSVSFVDKHVRAATYCCRGLNARWFLKRIAVKSALYIIMYAYLIYTFSSPSDSVLCNASRTRWMDENTGQFVTPTASDTRRCRRDRWFIVWSRGKPCARRLRTRRNYDMYFINVLYTMIILLQQRHEFAIKSLNANLRRFEYFDTLIFSRLDFLWTEIRVL